MIALGLATVVGLASPAVAEDSAKKKKKTAEESIVGVLPAAAATASAAATATSTSTSTAKRGAFVGLLTAKADDTTSFRAGLLDRRSGNLLRVLAAQQKALQDSINSLSKRNPNPANPVQSFYKSLVTGLVNQTNRFTSRIDLLTSVVGRLDTVDPDRGEARATQELRFLASTTSLYAQVNAFVAKAGLDLVVATPSAP